MPDDDFSDRLADLDPCWHVTLTRDEGEDDWQLTSNCPDQETVVHALMSELFKFATGQQTFGHEEDV